MISAYELLEEKRGLSVRMTGAVMFIMLRLTWMSLLLHLSSQAMLQMLGLRQEQLPYVALAIGIVAITYASFGGLRAVVITDLLQFCLLFGGAVLVVATVTVRLGGFGLVPDRVESNLGHPAAFQPGSECTRHGIRDDSGWGPLVDLHRRGRSDGGAALHGNQGCEGGPAVLPHEFCVWCHGEPGAGSGRLLAGWATFRLAQSSCLRVSRRIESFRTTSFTICPSGSRGWSSPVCSRRRCRVSTPESTRSQRWS